MTVIRAFGIILGAGVLFAIGGGLVGYTLGVTIPDYYRGVFEGGENPEFHPVAVGTGLGVSQGLIAGLFIGAIVVFAVAWYNSRIRSSAQGAPEIGAARAVPKRRPLWRWIPLALLLVLGLFFATRVPGCLTGHEAGFSSADLVSAKAEDLKSTVVTPHLDAPIAEGRNVLWCGSFQLVWNEVCALVGEDIHFAADPPIVVSLNKKAFTRGDLDEASYVAVADFVRNNPMGKIQKALLEKFHGQASPHYLPDMARTPRPQDIVAYAYLFKNLEFPRPFERCEGPLTFEATPVASFGLGAFKIQHLSLYPQVSILDYTDPDHFCIELKTKSREERVILAKRTPGATLADTVAAVEAVIAAGKTVAVTRGDVLAVPLLNFDLVREYRELYGQPLLIKNPNVAKDLVIVAALQDTRFQMDEKGVRLRSESHMSIACSAEEPPPPPQHIMLFDKPFLILMQRSDAKIPYFALWVGSDELLIPFKD